MKRKITRSSLEQLAKELPVLSEQEQRYYIGGGSGTEQDPYDYEEYRRMSVSGTWMGGYVLCSSELDAPVSEGNSGNVTKSHNASVIYFAKGVKALDDATVIGKRAGSGNVDGGTGSLPSGPRPYWPYRGWSDEYPYDPTIVSGNYPDDQDSSEEGEAWGFSRPKTPKQQSEWDKLNQDLSRYGFKYDGSGDATTKETLRTILETLLGSNSFKDFLSRHQTTTAIPVTIKIGESDMTAYGFTTYGRSPNGTVTIVEKIHPGLLNYSIARHAGIGAAATIIHETIHARLAGALASLNIHPNKIHNETTEDYKIFHSDTFKKAYPGLYDYYSRFDNQQAEHEQMALHYRGMIKNILQEAFPGLSDKTYEALSWSGLQKTSAWKKLEDNLASEYKRIITLYKKESYT